MINTFYTKPFPIINIGNDYVLREQDIKDSDAFLEYYAHTQVNQHILASQPKNLAEASAEIHYCRSLFQYKKGVYWTIARKSDDKMVGAAGIYINNQHCRGEICYELAHPFWNQGIMTRVLRGIIDYSFNCIGLARLEASTLDLNQASIALLIKLGFNFEGTMKKYRYFQGNFYDIEMYSLISPKVMAQSAKRAALQTA